MGVTRIDCSIANNVKIIIQAQNSRFFFCPNTSRFSSLRRVACTFKANGAICHRHAPQIGNWCGDEKIPSPGEVETSESHCSTAREPGPESLGFLALNKLSLLLPQKLRG